MREGFFDGLEESALLFNLKADPFERHGGWKSEEVAMRLGVAWGGQVQRLLAEHYGSLQQYPPRQKGATLRPR